MTTDSAGQNKSTVAPFTSEQRAVIAHPVGHALVAAVAGSGKTETLLGRVVELHRRGVHGARILCLMYNKAARLSFTRRLAAALPDYTPAALVHTFHGHARRLEHALVQDGCLSQADLAGAGDLRPMKLQRATLRAAFKERVSPDSWPSQRDVEDFQRFITLAKAQTGPPRIVAERLFPKSAQAGLILAAFEAYETERKRAQWRAFDDLLYDTVPLVAASQDLRTRFGNQFDHVLVDEMQDMNQIQSVLLQIRAAPAAAVMGVGDDDQCLYEFRGADPAIFITDFEKSFPGTTRYTLSRTFRFGHTLSLAAGQLVAHNRERVDKLVVSAPGTPDTTLTITQRAFQAVDLTALRAAKRLLHWSEVLILVRYRAQTVMIELDLLSAGIPYEIEGSSGLFLTRIIGGLIALLSLSGHRWPQSADVDAQAWMLRDLLKQPTLFLNTDQLERAIAPALKDMRQLPASLRTMASSLKETTNQRAIRDRADLLEMLLAPEMAQASADEVLNLYLVGTRMEEEIRRTALTVEAADEDLSWIEAFRRYVRSNQGTVGEILDALGIAREQADETERVRVTTIHGAKGLQSPIVILPGWVSGEFPRHGAAVCRADSGDEGERRLAYVALTRAQNEAHVYTGPDPHLESAIKTQDIPDGSYRVSRYVYEMRPGTAYALSQALCGKARFDQVRPTDARHARQYLLALGRTETIPEGKVSGGTAATSARAHGHPKEVHELPIGWPVHHDAWGPGTIVEIVGDTVARVTFERGGERLILLSTGKLKPVKDYFGPDPYENPFK